MGQHHGGSIGAPFQILLGCGLHLPGIAGQIALHHLVAQPLRDLLAFLLDRAAGPRPFPIWAPGSMV